MRESDERSGSLFSYVDLEGRVRRDHPLRTSREIANVALADLTGEFAELYPPRLGRPAAGDRGGLPQLACPGSRGAPDGFARRRAQSAGALEHATEYLPFYSTVLTFEKPYEVKHQLRTIWSEAPNVRCENLQLPIPSGQCIGEPIWRPAKWHCRSESRNSTASASQVLNLACR